MYGEGNGNPLQHSCLENPMDRGAWQAAVYGVAQSRTQLSDFTFTFHFSCIGEENGNPLQCSCLENPREGGAWWAAFSGVTQSQTRLKCLSSSSSKQIFAKIIIGSKNVFITDPQPVIYILFYSIKLHDFNSGELIIYTKEIGTMVLFSWIYLLTIKIKKL